MNKINIFCTIGPASLNKDFLKSIKNKVDLLRVNLSHTSVANFPKVINFIRKYSNIPICVDTEGSQIRTKVKKKSYLKKNQKFKIQKKSGNFKIYPNLIRWQAWTVMMGSQTVPAAQCCALKRASYVCMYMQFSWNR